MHPKSKMSGLSNISSLKKQAYEQNIILSNWHPSTILIPTSWINRSASSRKFEQWIVNDKEALLVMFLVINFKTFRLVLIISIRKLLKFFSDLYQNTQIFTANFYYKDRQLNLLYEDPDYNYDEEDILWFITKYILWNC